MKKYSTMQINYMVRKIEEVGIVIDTIDTVNEMFTVEKKSLRGLISFNDFNQDLDIFISDMEMILGIGVIEFDMNDLVKGVLQPTCTCGCKNIERSYDGEITEDYHFRCTCGSEKILNGYYLDSLLD